MDTDAPALSSRPTQSVPIQFVPSSNNRNPATYHRQSTRPPPETPPVAGAAAPAPKPQHPSPEPPPHVGARAPYRSPRPSTEQPPLAPEPLPPPRRQGPRVRAAALVPHRQSLDMPEHQSADGYTHIFDKVREEKQTQAGKPVAYGKDGARGNGAKQHHDDSYVSSKFSCFGWCK